MKKTIQDAFNRLKKDRTLRHRMMAAILVLSLAISAGIGWELRILGVSMEDPAATDPSAQMEATIPEETAPDDTIPSETTTDPVPTDPSSVDTTPTDTVPSDPTSAVLRFTQQTLTAQSGDSVIVVTGLLPEGSWLDARPVEAQVDGEVVLLAFDITIFRADGSLYEPEDGSVSVCIQSPQIGQNSQVYYIPADGQPEKLDSQPEDGSVAFDADHFSVYAVTTSSQIIAGGTIDNGTDTGLAWELTEDFFGARILTISGEGPIPDYSQTGSQAPWYDYRSTDTDIIIGQGVTTIGNYAFYNWRILSVQFSPSVESIGMYAFENAIFSYGSIVIPGTIKTISESAFSCTNLSSITLEEGIETIGAHAFFRYDSTAVKRFIHLPDSLVTIGRLAFQGVVAYSVNDTNPYYSVMEGVLYNKDGTVLIDYPDRKIADIYTIPESVTSIKTSALSHVYQTKELYIGNNIQEVSTSDSFKGSSYVSIYIEDGVAIWERDHCWGCSNLAYLRLPENTRVEIYGIYDAPYATFFKIPNGTVNMHGVSFKKMTSLENLYYDAQKCWITDAARNPFDGTTISYHLTIGPNVDTIYANFCGMASYAHSVSFEGPNTLYITDGAFADAPAPFTGLSGWVYVDANGAVYALNTETKTAELIYCPAGVTALTVPASITTVTDEETTFTVTSVARDALKEATSLTSITFENAAAITSLADYAMANAPIASVTDLAAGKTETSEEGAAALFPNATQGYGVFYNTNLTGAAVYDKDFADHMSGSRALLVKTDDGKVTASANVVPGETTIWQDNENGGGYMNLTGDTMKINVTTTNTSAAPQTYRVYLTVTDPDCVLGYVPGNTYTITDDSSGDTLTVLCYATADPNTICLEFSREVDQTANFSINAIYLSPSSDGGGLTARPVILSGDEELENGVIQAHWSTRPVTYAVSKTNHANNTSVAVLANQEGVYLGANLQYTIKLTRDGTADDAFGKDYVTYVEYTDVLTLPEGMTWSAELLEALKNGKIYPGSTITINGTSIVYASLSGTSQSLQRNTLSLNEEGEVVLTWRVKNTGTADLGSSTINLYFYPAAFELTVKNAENGSGLEAGGDYKITNTVTATVHYSYSQPQTNSDTVEKILTVGEGNINVSKSGNTSYLGQAMTFTLKIYNNSGLAWTGEPGTHLLRDDLPTGVYIKADNMEKMFLDGAGRGQPLTITISNAHLGAGRVVTAADGVSTAWINTGNSDLADEYTTTMTITYADGLYTIAYGETSTASGASIEEMFHTLGYGVTRDTAYTCVWTLCGEKETYTLYGGQTEVYYIYSTAKDTFQRIGSDWPVQHPASDILINNQKAWVEQNGTALASSGVAGNWVKREAAIAKSVSKDGQILGSAPAAITGDVLDYTLTFTHRGSGEYDDLPMVDDLCGSQYLLVPVAQNEKNEALDGLNQTEHGGVTYYILTEGSYKDVVVGQDADGAYLTAATIIVTSGDGTALGNSYSGIHTQIKWYFAHLDGGNYQIKVTYQAIIDSGENLSYTIGNVVWMNDRTWVDGEDNGSRIYAGLWGGGTIIDYDKQIVDKKGTTPDEDQLDEDRHSAIAAGDSVTYRLELKSDGTFGTFSLNGANLADLLPETYGTFSWTKDNISMTVETRGNVTGYENLTSKWSIGDTYRGMKGSFICWDDDVKLTFTGASGVYIYVTLTFPANAEDSAVWSSYVARTGGSLLENTVYVYGNPASVTHVLKEPGEVLLEKGVYALYKSAYTGSSRYYYNNPDFYESYAIYYVVLYNDAATRLYLNELQDLLPEGFTFRGLTASGAYVETTNYSVTTTGGTVNPLTQKDEEILYRTANITASTTAATGTSGQRVTFKVSTGSGNYAIKYDEDRKQNYLDSGEAIAFSYQCKIGARAETADAVTNVISMPYTDYTGAGVHVTDQVQIKTADILKNDGTPVYGDQNIGDCQILPSQQVSSQYGFTSDAGSQWLTSEVTLIRGAIAPGIRKDTVSTRLDDESNPVIYSNNANPDAIVDWKVTLVNGGAQSILDYTFMDTMPSPYVFYGEVNVSICNQFQTSVASGTLFTIKSVGKYMNDLSGLETITITDKTGDRNITIGADPVQCKAQSGLGGKEITYWLRFSWDDVSEQVKNLVMTVTTTDVNLVIPEGGCIELTYSSYNPTNTRSNKTYLNTASLIPTQPFYMADIQAGLPLSDADSNPLVNDNGSLKGIYNISPLTTTNGYATNAYKTVTEKKDPSNIAYSNKAENHIVLPGADSLFTYTLTVVNGSETNPAMEKLVLIDNLPFVGDTYAFNEQIFRNSQFGVTLADSPNFTVTVKKADGTTVALDESAYTVQYSIKTGNFTTDDRSGVESADWTDATEWKRPLSEVRSIRLVILDETDATDETGGANTSKLPGGSVISFSFDAQASGTPEPGAIAWNNFGYRYKVKGDSDLELEAMPLSVGVKVPTAPELVKKLVLPSGHSYSAAKDLTFQFLVHTGEALDNYDLPEEELVTALEERDYQIWTVTVAKGESASGTVKLTTEEWTWTPGMTYTIAELQTDSDYGLYQWTMGSRLETGKTCTFTYDPDWTVSLACSNAYQIWNLELTKVDADSVEETGQTDPQALAGATFALYSLVNNSFTQEGVKPFITVSGETWYLCDVTTTGDDGKIFWQNLTQEQYYLVEVKAPDGYSLNPDPILATRPTDGSTQQSLTVENQAGVILPNSGGSGITLIICLAMILTMAPILLLLDRRRRLG